MKLESSETHEYVGKYIGVQGTKTAGIKEFWIWEIAKRLHKIQG